MYNKSLRSSRSAIFDQPTEPLRLKRDPSMWSDSSKHSNGINIDIPKNTLNITHLKKITKSKFEVFNCEDDLKEIIFTSTTTLKEDQKILNTPY